MAENGKQDHDHQTGSRIWLLVGLVLFCAGACWWMMRRSDEARLRQAAEIQEASPVRHEGAANPGRSSASQESETAKLPSDEVEADILLGVVLSRPTAEILSEVTPAHGGLAVRDAAGHIYFTASFENKHGVFRRSTAGEEKLLWKHEQRATHVEIAGLDGEHLILADVAGPPAAEVGDAWRSDGPFYGLSTGASSIGVWPDHSHEAIRKHFREAK